MCNQLSGFNLPCQWGQGAMFQHLVKAFLDQLLQRCGKNLPLHFLSFSSWFGLSLWLSYIHPTHCLLYFMLMSCCAHTPIFAVHTACHKESQYHQVICSTYLILSFSYSENCLKFMFSLWWFCLLVLLLPQVTYGQVLGIQVPDVQCSLFGAKRCCPKLLPSLLPSTNDCSLLLSLLACFFPLSFPLSQGIISK